MSRGFNESRTVMPFSEPAQIEASPNDVQQPGEWELRNVFTSLNFPDVGADPGDDAPTQPGDWVLVP